MPTYQLEIAEARPFFAELPYYVWGQVNYDSNGDCTCPTDRHWSSISLTHRETGQRLAAFGKNAIWTIEGPDPAAARLTYFLQARCDGRLLGASPVDRLSEWDHERALGRAALVEREFGRAELAPFAIGHDFWGSWKWIGWFATTFTWVGRWIMDSVVRKDSRAVSLCIDWLQAGPVGESQSAALRYALHRLTGLSFGTDAAWVDWYVRGSGKEQFPEPDFDSWYADMKRIHGESLAPMGP